MNIKGLLFENVHIMTFLWLIFIASISPNTCFTRKQELVTPDRQFNQNVILIGKYFKSLNFNPYTFRTLIAHHISAIPTRPQWQMYSLTSLTFTMSNAHFLQSIVTKSIHCMSIHLNPHTSTISKALRIISGTPGKM